MSNSTSSYAPGGTAMETLVVVVPSNARSISMGPVSKSSHPAGSGSTSQSATSTGSNAAGLDLTWTASLTELLDKLLSQVWSATLLSLSVDPVDEDVARRVGAERNAGALLLSAPGASLERAILVEQGRCRGASS